MPVPRFFLLGLTVLSSLLCAADASDNAPRTVYWDGAHMASVKRQLDEGEPVAPDALARLRRCAEEALTRGPYTVLDKSVMPPSGDKHDYLSYSRYWWPDSAKKDGLPYIRRDGVVNRKLLAKGDRLRIGLFYDDVESLAIAHYYFRDPRYVNHARTLLRTWFLDPDTRMNPNVKYGQGVPGRAVGRGVGIMDTRHFIRILESIEVLCAVKGLADRDRDKLGSWFRHYLDWLVDSDLGKKERQSTNNHGTWYDAQVVRIALFVEDDDLAQGILKSVPADRMVKQITTDGRQPQELKRTQSLHYSLYNLAAYCALARMSESVGNTLWTASPPDAGGIHDAFNYLAPYVGGGKPWPHPQIRPVKLSQREVYAFFLAADRYNDPSLFAAMRRTRRHDSERDFATLLFRTPSDEIGR